MASAIIAGAFILLGGDNIYSIFKKDLKYGYIIPEERELYYAGCIADKFDEYINNPPKELLHKTFSEDEEIKKKAVLTVMKYVIILQKSLISNDIFMKR